MGMVREFIEALDAFEKTEEYNKHNEGATLDCPECVDMALNFIMKRTRGHLDPSFVRRLILCEYHI